MDGFPDEVKNALDIVLNAFDGGLVVDEKGIVVVYTDKYAEVAEVPKQEVLGSFVIDVFPDSRMLEIITKGKPIYIDIWEAGEETVFVSRYPITYQGRIIGAVAVCVFRYLDEAQGFAAWVGGIQKELSYYKSQMQKISGAQYSFNSIIGNSSLIAAAKENAQSMVKARTPVLILGETGSGKELFAHAIHQASPRRDRPFIRVNCASIPENLVESELFGYDEGAFSGAKKGGKPGKFEMAHGGTIFLDEVNELPYHIQAKLLRVLQEGEIDHVGGTDLTYVDVRVISATSSDLPKLIAEKRFRADLFYRINAFQLKVPSLRERTEDIPLICDYFINSSNCELGTSINKIESKVLQLFSRYRWPGNVRELRNVIQRACLIAGSGIIRMNHLPPEFADQNEYVRMSENKVLGDVIQQAEKEQIVRALGSVGGNRNKTAELLGINRTQLYRKMKKYELI